MSEYKRQTENKHNIDLPSKISFCHWRKHAAIIDSDVYFDIVTEFVADKTAIEIQATDLNGKVNQIINEVIINNEVKGKYTVPHDAEDNIILTASVADYSLEAKSAPLLVLRDIIIDPADEHESMDEAQKELDELQYHITTDLKDERFGRVTDNIISEKGVHLIEKFDVEFYPQVTGNEEEEDVSAGASHAVTAAATSSASKPNKEQKNESQEQAEKPQAKSTDSPENEEKPEISLVITKVDSHFAPSKEKLDIEFSVENHQGQDGKLIVTSESYGSTVFEKELSASEISSGKISWDGKSSCGDGELADHYINPLYAPYKVEISCSGIKDTKEFCVYYHSINMELGTYTPDGKAPPKSDKIKWVQYRLNELGYFAGPVDGVKNEQTIRALRRYTYSAAGYYDDEKEIDDINNEKLLKQLEAGEGKIDIIEGGKLPTDGNDIKVYIDHNHFFQSLDNGGDFDDPEGHIKRDKEKLDRFEMPVEAKIFLVGKNDSNGSQQPVDAPEAVGAAPISWAIKDPIEDISLLPEYSPNCPTQSKAYIENALKKLGRDTNNPEETNDNCPASLAGQRDNNANYFRNEFAPFDIKVSGDKVLSHVIIDNGQRKKGKAGILFQGSYIAGDNYKLQASIALKDNEKNKKLHDLHKTFFSKDIEQQLAINSGKMTIWRKHNVSAIIDWPTPADPNIKWDDITKSYKAAHCELNTDNIKTYSITDIFSTKEEQNKFLDIYAESEYKNKGMRDEKRSLMKFSAKGIYPETIPSQEDKFCEDDPEYYKSIISLLAANMPFNTKFQERTSGIVYSKIRKNSTSGIIILRCNWLPTVKIHDITNNQYELFTPEKSSAALPNGVVIIDNKYSQDSKDSFLFSHEIAHCLNLSHHEIPSRYDSANKEDHDLSDHNCTMSYPQGIRSRPDLEWNKTNSDISAFCGKCLMKLRGWQVNSNELPDDNK